MNSRPILAYLLRKYQNEKWLLSPQEIKDIHDSMGTFYKKFHAPGIEQKLSAKEHKIWFGLKSGIIFDQDGFLMVGDAMDELHFSYQLTSSMRNHFVKIEGHLLHYRNNGDIKKMTLSFKEIAFLKQYFTAAEKMIKSKPWDWEEVTDL